MTAALAPAGWLLVEDMDWAAAGSSTGRHGKTLDYLLLAASLVLRSAGYDKTFGRRLPALFGELGLSDVGAEGRVVFLVGGGPNVDWARPSLERFRLLITDKAVFGRFPALRRLVDGRLDHIETLLADPTFAFAAPAMVATWGRRPPS